MLIDETKDFVFSIISLPLASLRFLPENSIKH